MSIKAYPCEIGGYKFFELETVEEKVRKSIKQQTKIQQNQFKYATLESLVINNSQEEFVLQDQQVQLHEVKNQLRLKKKTLQKIVMQNVQFINQLWLFKILKMNQLSRSEVIIQLLKQEDLTIADFPNLKKIVIELTPSSHEITTQQNNKQNQYIINNNNSQLTNDFTSNLEDEKVDYLQNPQALKLKIYQDLKIDIQETLNSHIHLKNFMSDKQVILIDYVFLTMETFLYVYKFLDINYQTIEKLVFRNIKRLQNNTFIKLSQIIDKQQSLKEITFEYVFLQNQHIQVIRDILGRRRSHWISIKFIQCGLNEFDIQTLFMDNIKLYDLSSLKKISLIQNPLLYNSKIIEKLQQSLKDKMKNLIIYNSSDMDDDDNSQNKDDQGIQQKQEKLKSLNMQAKGLIMDNLFNQQNYIALQNILLAYTQLDCCQILSLKNFNIGMSTNTLQNLLVQFICGTKSLIYINLKNTNPSQQLITKISQKLNQNKKILAYFNLSNSSISDWSDILSYSWPLVKVYKIKNINLQATSENLSNNQKLYQIINYSEHQQIISEDLSKQNINYNHYIQSITKGIKKSNQFFVIDIFNEILDISINNEKLNVNKVVSLSTWQNLITQISEKSNLNKLNINGWTIQQNENEELLKFSKNLQKENFGIKFIQTSLNNSQIFNPIYKSLFPQFYSLNKNCQQNVDNNGLEKISDDKLIINILKPQLANNQVKLLQQATIKIGNQLNQENISTIQTVYNGMILELYEDIQLVNDWHFTKPLQFFQNNGLAFKSLLINYDYSTGQPIQRSEKFGYDILQGLQKAFYKINWKTDTISHNLNYLDISNCTHFTNQQMTDFALLLLLEKSKQQDDDTAEQLKIDQEQQIVEMQQQLSVEFDKTQHIYLNLIHIERINQFINLCEIKISASGYKCHPNTVKYLLVAAIFAAGNNLRQITIGPIEELYCLPLSQGLQKGKEKLKEYQKVNYDPEELSLQEIESFPEQLVRIFLTSCGKKKKTLKIRGQGIFQGVKHLFEDFEQKNQKKNVNLSILIFKYSSCFGISEEERFKLYKTVIGPYTKYVDIQDEDQQQDTNFFDQKNDFKLQQTSQNNKRLSIEFIQNIDINDQDIIYDIKEIKKIILELNNKNLYDIAQQIKLKQLYKIKKYIFDETIKLTMYQFLKQYRQIFYKLKLDNKQQQQQYQEQQNQQQQAIQQKNDQILIDFDNTPEKIYNNNNSINSENKEINTQQQLLLLQNKVCQHQIILQIDCQKFNFPLQIAHAMHSYFIKNDFIFEQIEEMLFAIFVNGPEKLFIDFLFLEDFLLGTLGIYPSSNCVYSYILKPSFFQFLKKIGLRLRARQLQFLPTLVNQNMEIFGEGDDKYEVLRIYTQLKETALEQITYNYSWTQDKQFSKIQLKIDPASGREVWEPKTEKQLIDLFVHMPPSKFSIKNISINALKLIYVICYNNPNFQNGQIEYDSENFVNAGIAYSLRDYFRTPEISQYKINKQGKLSINLKYYLYKGISSLLNLIVQNDIVYKYDDSVIALDSFLQKSSKIYFFILILTFFYYFICCFCPYYFSETEGLVSNEQQNQGVSWKSHYIYGVFAVFTFFVEIYLYVNTLKRMFHLAPPLQLAVENGVIQRFMNNIKKKIINFQWFNYQFIIFGQTLLLSQNQRLDFYSDVSFVILCLQNGYNKIALTSFCILLIILVHNLSKLINNLIHRLFFDKTKNKISTHYINEFYEAAVNIEFVALGYVLNILAPYNVFHIPNNVLTRKLIPKYAGLSISTRMTETTFKIFVEDVPQIILQIIFMQQTNKSDYTIVISFSTSILSIVSSLITFLTMRPSIIRQQDFQKLSKRKRDKMYIISKNFYEGQKIMWQKIQQGILVKNNNQSEQGNFFNNLFQLKLDYFKNLDTEI